jgi:hypothetical protein
MVWEGTGPWTNKTAGSLVHGVEATPTWMETDGAGRS